MPQKTYIEHNSETKYVKGKGKRQCVACKKILPSYKQRYCDDTCLNSTKEPRLCATCQTPLSVRKHRYCSEGCIPRLKMQPVYARWISCRSRSRARGFDFDLTMEDVEVLMNAPCHYCGDKNNPQIDRKDNARGYTRDNVVPACKRCNTVKGHLLTYEEMLKVIDALEWRK